MYVSQVSQPVQDEFELEGCSGSRFLKKEAFTSLSQRLAKEDPDLLPALHTLKNSMDAHEFEKYIESLVRIRKSNDLLLVITDKAMHRSIIEGRFRDQIAKCFNTKYIRVLSEA